MYIYFIKKIATFFLLYFLLTINTLYAQCWCNDQGQLQGGGCNPGTTCYTSHTGGPGCSAQIILPVSNAPAYECCQPGAGYTKC